MAITAYKIIVDGTTDALEAKIKTQLTADPDWQLFGPPDYSPGTRQWAQTLIKGTGIAGGGGVQNAADIGDATPLGIALLTAATPEAVREAIDAGTSDLVLGLAADTAKPGDWLPTSADLTDASPTGVAVLTAPAPADARTALELSDFAIYDATAAATALGLGNLATLDTVAPAQITGITATGTSLLTAVNAATARNLIELGQLATLNEVTASQISDNTVTNAEISPTANIAATKLAGTDAGRALLGITRQPAIPNISAPPTAADYNAILTVLRNVGLIAP